MAQASSLAQFLIVVIAAWLARQQEAFIECLGAENRMHRARLGRRRLIFTDGSSLAEGAQADRVRGLAVGVRRRPLFDCYGCDRHPDPKSTLITRVFRAARFLIMSYLSYEPSTRGFPQMRRAP